MIYQGYVRLVDHHRVLHLARLMSSMDEALCGRPPVGNYLRVCPVCNDLAGGEE